MNPVDYGSDENTVLLNPRLPADEQTRLRSLLGGLAGLRRHVLVATSGSSGGAKWVALSKEAILAAAEASNTFFGAGRGDVWLRSLPTFHVGGLSLYARALLAGGKVVEPASQRWEPLRFVAECDGATWVSLVPTQVFDLVQLGVRGPSSIRGVLVGGGALLPSLAAEARELGWPVFPSYGLTETASQAATDRGSGLEVLPHLQASVDLEGRLKFSGASLLTGYVTSEGLIDPKEEGWFTTEDFGSVLGRVVTVSGRALDRVKVGGELTNLARLREVWSVVSGGLAGSSVVLAAPDERLENRVVLAAEVGLTVEAAVASFNALVAPFERIQEVVFVESLPRTELGKIRWSELSSRVSRR